ncbi:MAG: extracellular solute-binding protein [Oscillospiraceae bacterium]|nr:extracellular solute-binding protein [Oscillospiraceae bacterium]
MKRANRLITILIFIFLYIPMAVLIVASFNTGKDIAHFESFTWNRYIELFQDDGLLNLLANSLIVAVLSTSIATVFGTVAAVGIHNLKPRMRKIAMTLTNIPMTNPDIVTGVSLSLLFVFVGTRMLGQRDSLTFWTLLIAHITFSLPYVVLNVMPKLHQMDNSLVDAAMDLGCTPMQSFFKVTIHEIMPGIVTGAIMAFTMSLDDFVISYFVSGLDFTTLPVEIYSYTKKPIQPKVYAMFTLMFLLIFLLMVISNLLQLGGEQRKTRSRGAASERSAGRIVKIAVAGAAALAIVVGCAIFIGNNGAEPPVVSEYTMTELPAGPEESVTINVYNWGQYIADGSDDSLDIIAAFEEAYPNIKVNYSTYDSNEIMYSKLANGGITVDVIIPSDYMIARLISENMLLELNFDNIPNYQYIDETFRNTSFDPENKYSVPYTWGTVGIIYNSKYVDEADVTGWELLWNEKYTDKILMFGNSRDAFGITQYMLGYDVNTTDEGELTECAQYLMEQKPVLQQYVMDEIFGIMQNEEAWIAPYYAGDYLTMAEENPALSFYLPEHQGFNLFIDSICIPSCAKEKEAAELFINFLCDPKISAANMEWVCYSTPISEAKQFLDPEVAESEISYPAAEKLIKASSYAFLNPETTRTVEAMFMEVRNSR